MSPQKDECRRTEALDQLFAMSHSQLRQLAAYLKRFDGSLTLNVTALLNETYVKLREAAPNVESLLHLRRMAGKAMRNILVDAARQRKAEKRGGDIQFVAWDENLEPFAKDDQEFLALDAALDELAAMDPWQSELVESHFFGGLSWSEVAQSLGVSIATVERDWRIIRAWLHQTILNQR